MFPNLVDSWLPCSDSMHEGKSRCMSACLFIISTFRILNWRFISPNGIILALNLSLQVRRNTSWRSVCFQPGSLLCNVNNLNHSGKWVQREHFPNLRFDSLYQPWNGSGWPCFYYRKQRQVDAEQSMRWRKRKRKKKRQRQPTWHLTWSKGAIGTFSAQGGNSSFTKLRN